MAAAFSVNSDWVVVIDDGTLKAVPVDASQNQVWAILDHNGSGVAVIDQGEQVAIDAAQVAIEQKRLPLDYHDQVTAAAAAADAAAKAARIAALEAELASLQGA